MEQSCDAVSRPTAYVRQQQRLGNNDPVLAEPWPSHGLANVSQRVVVWRMPS
jgi:hypothetical protein